MNLIKIKCLPFVLQCFRFIHSLIICCFLQTTPSSLCSEEGNGSFPAAALSLPTVVLVVCGCEEKERRQQLLNISACFDLY